MPRPFTEPLQDLTRPRINRAPSPVLALSLPWILVMLGSLSPTWPIIASAPILPPLGFLLLLAWLHLRPGLFPVWAGLPLGLFDDLFSGQPMGSGVVLWSLAALGMDYLENRVPWRGFMTNWLVASAIIVAYLLAAAQIAGGFGDGARMIAMLPQLGAAILAYPIAAQLVGLVDRLRLIPLREVQ